jgi:hypothetical protein
MLCRDCGNHGCHRLCNHHYRGSFHENRHFALRARKQRKMHEYHMRSHFVSRVLSRVNPHDSTRDIVRTLVGEVSRDCALTQETCSRIIQYANLYMTEPNRAYVLGMVASDLYTAVLEVEKLRRKSLLAGMRAAHPHLFRADVPRLDNLPREVYWQIIQFVGYGTTCVTLTRLSRASYACATPPYDPAVWYSMLPNMPQFRERRNAYLRYARGARVTQENMDALTSAASLRVLHVPCVGDSAILRSCPVSQVYVARHANVPDLPRGVTHVTAWRVGHLPPSVTSLCTYTLGWNFTHLRELTLHGRRFENSQLTESDLIAATSLERLTLSHFDIHYIPPSVRHLSLFGCVSNVVWFGESAKLYSSHGDVHAANMFVEFNDPPDMITIIRDALQRGVQRYEVSCDYHLMPSEYCAVRLVYHGDAKSRRAARRHGRGVGNHCMILRQPHGFYGTNMHSCVLPANVTMTPIGEDAWAVVDGRIVLVRKR